MSMANQHPVNIERKEHGSTRQNILRLLRQQGQMTATELSQQLNIGAVGVRQHLALLERDGLVEVTGLRRSIGRPSHLYTLTPEAERCFPKTYDRLVINVLNHIADQGGEPAITAVLAAHRAALLRTYAGRMTGKTRTDQVAELVAILNEEGHMAEAEQVEDGSYYLTVHNCPLDEVAHEYRQLCAQDLALFQELLGVPMVREANIMEGDIYCRYHIPA